MGLPVLSLCHFLANSLSVSDSLVSLGAVTQHNTALKSSTHLYSITLYHRDSWNTGKALRGPNDAFPPWNGQSGKERVRLYLAPLAGFSWKRVDAKTALVVSADSP